MRTRSLLILIFISTLIFTGSVIATIFAWIINASTSATIMRAITMLSTGFWLYFLGRYLFIYKIHGHHAYLKGRLLAIKMAVNKQSLIIVGIDPPVEHKKSKYKPLAANPNKPVLAPMIHTHRMEAYNTLNMLKSVVAGYEAHLSNLHAQQIINGDNNQTPPTNQN